MTSTAKLLYCYLTDTVGRKRKLARSSKKIGAAVGISRTAVSRNMHLLRQNGLIEIVPQFTDDGGRIANKYILK
ncbi:MAG: hypothetical protein WHF31_06205 [Candidatus Dehalobacter alkaniphilus]|uniref:hypothetical protein n=1 Tax=Dehalobacter sp. DCM TaxID=2907827 RepID=UPI003081EEC6|nr:hypothetical protein LPY66_01565 [Dehalobacter sp. DCM]